jgi:hypothetical protein
MFWDELVFYRNWHCLWQMSNSKIGGKAEAPATAPKGI